MEDTKDKVRRNLVVFSALFAAGAFLNIEPSKTSPWVPELLKEVDQLRLQIVFLAILVYLSFRWFCSEEQRHAFLKLKEFWFSAMEKLCRTDGLKAMENHQEEDHSDSAKYFLAQSRGQDRTLGKSFDRIIVSGWMRKVQVHYLLLASGPHVSAGIDRMDIHLDLEFSVWKWMARQISCLFASLKSEYFWEWVAPLVMSYVALLVIARRLVLLVFF